MSIKLVSVLLAAGVIASRPACAGQDAKPGLPDKTTTPAPTAPIAPTAVPYLLAGEDVISITVIHHPQYSSQIVIPPDGHISMPLLEPFSVTGKTTQEVAQMLTEKYRKYYKNPSVNVTLAQKRRENVLIYGFVSRVGTLEYRPALRLLEVLAEAGGASPSGDLSKVTLTRKSGDKQVLDISRPETKGGTEVDILLQPGDVIYVPERNTKISVLGEVAQPGSFDYYKDEITVIEAITKAGGVRETADLAAATLIHDGQEQPLDLEAILRRGELAGNIKLSPGDRIMIPELRNRTYVYGAVARPGYYLFKPGDRILDALNGSGGPLRDADLRKINVIRIDKQKNTGTVEEIDLQKFLKKGDMKYNVALGPGDVLFVPFYKKKFGIQDIFSTLSGLNIVDSTFRILNHGLGNSGRY